MKKTFKYTLLLCIALAVICCKKYKKSDPTLGTDVQPESDALYTTVSDTTTFEIHTVKYDSSRSFQDQFKYLGSNQDPVFGRTNASIFTNFSMPDGITNVSFGDDAVLDSAELILTFTQNFVGDSTTPQQYDVYQLTQSPDPTAAYYMHSKLPYAPTKIGTAVRRAVLTGGFYSIHIPLDKTFASSIITNSAYLINNDVFRSTYKGFYITTRNTALSPSQQGGLLKIDLDNTVSGVYMYYHNGFSAAGKEPKSYRFPFSSNNSARFNNIQYDPASGGNPMLINQLNKTDTALGKQDFFLKGLGGTKAIIHMPFLKNYSAANPVSVSRAEFIFKVDQSMLPVTGHYEPPLLLSLVAMDSTGRETFMKDQYSNSDLNRFGGSYDPVNKYYVFNIARHVQDILSGKLKNYGFYLVVANPDMYYVVRRDDRAERVVFGGLNNASCKPTFRLTYVSYPYDK